MPPRRDVERLIVEEAVGVHVWDGRTGQCQTMPTDEWDATSEAADGLWSQLVDLVDWNRVVIESVGRCLKLGHDLTDMTHAVGNLCGESIQAVLTADNHNANWAYEPGPWLIDSPLVPWLDLLADARRFRRVK